MTITVEISDGEELWGILVKILKKNGWVVTRMSKIKGGHIATLGIGFDSNIEKAFENV